MNLRVVDIEVRDLRYSSCRFLTITESIRIDARRLRSTCTAGKIYAHSLTIF